MPFDSKGQVLEFSAFGDYGNLSDKTTPELSGIYSNVFDTTVGRFGVLANYAYSHVKTETNEVDMTRIGAFCNGGDINANGQANMVDGNVGCTSNPFGGTGWAYISRRNQFLGRPLRSDSSRRIIRVAIRDQ